MEMKTLTFWRTQKLTLLVAAALLIGGVIFFFHFLLLNHVPSKDGSIGSHNMVLDSSSGGSNTTTEPLVLSASDAAAIASYDATRISDLAQLQTDIQLYHKKCGYYPGAPQAGSSCGPFVADGSYARLSAALMGSGLGITSIPNDPKTGLDYVYGTNAAGTSYTIGAQLEDPSNSALQQSPKDRSNGVGCGQAIGVYCIKS
jgi:hypothetical protein